ncbi:MAG: tetratricopeptide repeat protein [Bacteroidales bacterium]|nr:tetratricopeptide repeat protein [Bacteroidales bacterium]
MDRREVRSGNRKFRKGSFPEAELDYRKAVLKDSLSIAGEYNLASALYRQGNYDEAAQALGRADQEVAGTPHAASYYYNEGDVALQRKDYSAAVKAFRQCLLENPGDMDAKENYIYAKEMLKNQQCGGGGGDGQQNQDQQDQDQNQDQQDQQQQPDQQNQPDQQQNQDQPQPQQISQQQARQMLKAVQAQEKETQDKVKKEKAALLQSSQKEKNW